MRNMDRRLITILLIVFVQMLGASMILPILPLYASRQFAISPEIITLLVSSFFVAQFAAGPVLGRWSDKYGRLPVLILSQIGTTVSFLMLAFAPNVGWLFAARILDGVTGGNIVVAQAYITDIAPKEKRTEYLGYIFGAFGLGFIFGPALGGILSAAYGVTLPFIVAAGAAGVTVLLTWWTLDETLTDEQKETNRRFKKQGLAPRDILGNVPLMMVLLIAFFAQFAFGLLQSTFALYGDAVLFADASEETVNLGVGLLLTVVGLTQFTVQTFFLRRLLKVANEAMLVIGGSIVRGAAMLLFAVATSGSLGVVASMLFALGMGTMMPPLQSLSTNTVADELRGGVLGVYQSSISLATIFGTAVAGTLFALNPTIPYWLGGILSILLGLPGLILWRNSDNEVTKGAPTDSVEVGQPLD